ncbi:Signal transduction histidine kinase [Oscillospiraceae bacterium]|nr:Signal transduction histidine kinase [Oscillospiraceae bacterium]
MGSLSSPITLIKWVYSVICTVAVAVAAFIFATHSGAVIWSALTLILITSYLLTDNEDASRNVLALLLAASAVCAALVTGYWWSAFFFTVPALLADKPSLAFRNAVAFLSAAVTFVWGISRDNISRKYVVLYATLLILFYAAWMLIVFFMKKYEERLTELDRVVKISTLDSLNERNLREELAKQKALDEANARLMERERISRDIHNSVGHTLSAASVTLDAAQLLVDKDTELASRKMEQANVRVHEAIDSIRGVVRTLDSEDDTVLISDYVSSLSESISNFKMDTDIKVHHNFEQIEDEGKICIGTAAFISGALNELLTNGIKHGGADVFVVVLKTDSNNISLKVQDNGTGWGDISYEEKQMKLAEGFGLRKLRDHARSIGGNMEIDGSDGFVVSISLPRLTREEQDG